jgi:hypothetical protein
MNICTFFLGGLIGYGFRKHVVPLAHGRRCLPFSISANLRAVFPASPSPLGPGKRCLYLKDTTFFLKCSKKLSFGSNTIIGSRRDDRCPPKPRRCQGVPGLRTSGFAPVSGRDAARVHTSWTGVGESFPHDSGEPPRGPALLGSKAREIPTTRTSLSHIFSTPDVTSKKNYHCISDAHEITSTHRSLQ